MGCRDSATWGGDPGREQMLAGVSEPPSRKGQQLLPAEVGRVNSVKVEGLTVML